MITQRAAQLLVFLLLSSAVIACSESEGLKRPDPSPADTSALANTDNAGDSTESGSFTSSTAALPAESPKTTLTVQEQEAIDIMWEMFGGFGRVHESAVIAAGLNGHPGLVPVLVEAAARTFEPGLALEIAMALERITGDSVGGEFVLVEPWFSWMSRQDPPQAELRGFDEWKGELLGTIDPNFKQFIYSGVPTRIPLWTVEWGGVVRDGIPPLEFPKTVPAAEVDFLLPDEPVFGVTINGESRAYPHRIMGWHELSNDVLGGELITFVF